MATKYWNGDGAAGDFSDGDNWDDNAVPAGGDTLIFSSNSEDITGGDHTSITDTSTVVIVGKGWTGNFGTNVTPLNIRAASIEYSGQGTANYFTLSSTTTLIHVADTAGGDNALTLGGTGTITTLRVTGGRGTISSTGARTITTIEVLGASVANVDMSLATVVGTTLQQDSGVCKIAGNYTNIEIAGGTLEISGTPTSIATIDIYGGKVLYSVSGTTAAITSRLSVYEGVFDAGELSASVATITGAEVYEGGTIDEQNGLETIVWSGGISMHGGLFTPDAGRLLTVS